MAVTKIQEDMLRKFVDTFDLVCYYNGEPLTIDQTIDVFRGESLTKKDVDTRKEEFRASLKHFIKDYPKTMLIEFGKYWTELTRGGSKMRFELEITWSVKLRLERWHKHNYGNRSFKAQAPSATITKKPIKSQNLF